MNIFIETIEESGITAHLRKDGIVHLFIKNHTYVTHSMLENLIVQLKNLKKDKIPLIVEAGEFVTIGQDAKKYAKEFEDKANISSRIIIAKNLAQKILVNYYYKSQVLDKPFKEFNSLNDAESWLNENKSA